MGDVPLILINLDDIQTVTHKHLHIAVERVRNGAILHQALRVCLKTMHTKESCLVIIPIVWMYRCAPVRNALYHMSLVIMDCRTQAGGIQWFFNPTDEKKDPLSILTEIMKKEAPFIHGFSMRTLPSLDIPVVQAEAINISVFQCILLASLVWTMDSKPQCTEYIHRALRFWIEGNELDEIHNWIKNVIRMALQSSIPLPASCMKFSKSDIYNPSELLPTLHTVESFSDSDAV